MAVSTTPKGRPTKAAATLRPKGRTLAEFQPLWDAETELLHATREGREANISEACPTEETDATRVRASFVRFLALGGDATAPVHEHGVELQGAWIAGMLDLSGANVEAPLRLRKCRIEKVFAQDLRCQMLAFSGCRLEQGLNGDRMHCKGSVFLRDGFHASGEVRFIRATIGGSLSCRGGRFECVDGNALGCDGSKIGGNVLLNDKFHASGTVRLLGATIGGNLDCRAGRFEHAGASALICESASVANVLFFDKVTVAGRVKFNGLSVTTLVDDAASWAAAESIKLDGFTFRRFGGASPTDAATRIAWLEHQSADDLGKDFKPQPWEQLIKVLREMGHDDDAKRVAIAKQRQFRRAGRLGAPLWGTAKAHRVAQAPVIRHALNGVRILMQAKWPNRLLHTGWGLFAVYGYRPLRLSLVMVFVWLSLSGAFWLGMIDGAFAPTSPIIQTDLKAVEQCSAGPDAGESRWTRCAAVPDAYSSFQPTFYSLDLILPLVNLQQETEWAPVANLSGETYWMGTVMRGLVWFEILFGWVASLLLVASLTNLIKKD